MAGRKVRADEATELLAAWERSGEPMSQWCGRRGINWYSLSGYKGWLSTRWEPEAVNFAEVVADAAGDRTLGRYRVELGDWVVEVDDHFRDDTLRRLLRAVAAC